MMYCSSPTGGASDLLPLTTCSISPLLYYTIFTPLFRLYPPTVTYNLGHGMIMHFAQLMNRLAFQHQLIVLRTNYLVENRAVEVASGASGSSDVSVTHKPALGLSWLAMTTVQMLVK